MEVVSNCALPPECFLWQAADGSWVLTAICRATLLLQQGQLPLAATQDQPCERDYHEQDQPSASLRVPTDLVPAKKRVDVLLVGSACSPPKDPQQVLRCRLAIGNVDKAMLVHADRYFDQEGQLCYGPAFDKLALSYERASKGESNPVGMGPDVRDQYGRTAVPNLTPADAHITSPSDTVAPIGLGPLAPSWRHDRLPATAAGWSDASWNEAPLPEGFERSYFNCAPLDQQLDALQGDEHLVLEYLHEEHMSLHAQLPGIVVSASIDRGDGQASSETMRCDTVLIDTDRGTCSLTYKLDIALSGPTDQGQVTISAAGAGLESVGSAEDAAAPEQGAAEPVSAADEELPAHLAGLAGDVRETVSFDGFNTGDQPASTPFEAIQMPRPATGPQPSHGLPFKRIGEPAAEPPAVQPAPPPAVQPAPPPAVPAPAAPTPPPAVPAPAPAATQTAAAPRNAARPWAGGGSGWSSRRTRTSFRP